MLNHWIITNRPVVNDSVEDLRSFVRARPEFRIAGFDPLSQAVQFVTDEYVENYENLDVGADPVGLKGTQQLFLSLYQTMANAPKDKGDILFFMHGFNYSWQDSLAHLQKLHEIYVESKNSPICQIVYFSWPSVGDLLRYRADQENALPSGWMLGRLFAKVVQFYADFFKRRDGVRPAYCGKKIHMAAHSMGNQVMESFLKAVNNESIYRLNLFEEILLFNADLDWTALESGRPLYSLPEYGNRIHVYNHVSDDALHISESTKNNEKRLGRHGPRSLDLIPPRTLIVDCSAGSTASRRAITTPFERKSGFASRVKAISGELQPATQWKELMVDHWGYLYRNNVVDDIKAVLRGEPSSDIAGRSFSGNQLFRI